MFAAAACEIVDRHTDSVSNQLNENEIPNFEGVIDFRIARPAQRLYLL
jgi:hypothetical protein